TATSIDGGLAAAISSTRAVAIVRLPCIFQLPATSFLRMVCFRSDQTPSLASPCDRGKHDQSLARAGDHGQECGSTRGKPDDTCTPSQPDHWRVLRHRR